MYSRATCQCCAEDSAYHARMGLGVVAALQLVISLGV